MDNCISFFFKYNFLIRVELFSVGVELSSIWVELFSIGVELFPIGVELFSIGVELFSVRVELGKKFDSDRKSSTPIEISSTPIEKSSTPIEKSSTLTKKEKNMFCHFPRKYQFGRNKYWWVGAKKYNPANHAELAKKTVSSSAAAAGWRGRDGCLLSVAPKVRARWFYEKREIHSRKKLVGMEVAVPIPFSSSFYSSSWWPYPSPPSPGTQPARWGVCLNFFTMETSMFTINTRTNWNLKSML